MIETPVEMTLLEFEPLTTFGALVRGITSATSVMLVIFYTYQWHYGRSTLYSIYVQVVTAIVYCLAAIGKGEWMFARVAFGDEIREVAIGRYLVWMVTCPVMLFGFFGLISMLGPNVEPVKVNFMVMKDLLVMAFGVMASFQETQTVQYIFLACAIITVLIFITDVYYLERMRQDFFAEGDLLVWLHGITALLFISWGIFPLLYFLGPPVLNITSHESDVIGHAIGDLIGKNLFGFGMWYMRYNKLLPYIQSQGNAVCVYTGYELDPESHMVRYSTHMVVPTPEHHDEEEGASEKEKSRVWNVDQRVKILIIEPQVSFQRLFMYMLKDVNVDAEMAMDLNHAKTILRRGRVDEFETILVSLTSHFDRPNSLKEFKKIISSEPFQVPILGYTFDDNCLSMLEKEDHKNEMTHGIVHHVLDEVFLGDLIRHWAQTSYLWRETSRAREVESEIRRSASSLHLIRSSPGKTLRDMPEFPGAGSSAAGAGVKPMDDAEFNAALLARQQSMLMQASSFYQPPQQMYMQPQQQMPQQMPMQAPMQPQPQPQPQIIVSPASPQPPGGLQVQVPKTLPRKNSMSVPNSPVGTLSRQNSFSQGSPTAAGLVRQNSFSQGSPKAMGLSRQNSFVQGTPIVTMDPSAQPSDSACSNDGCSNRSEMICGGCHKATYCSRDCQLAHWRAGHKQVCKK